MTLYLHLNLYYFAQHNPMTTQKSWIPFRIRTYLFCYRTVMVMVTPAALAPMLEEAFPEFEKANRFKRFG